METSKLVNRITKEEFVQQFKLDYALAVSDPRVMETYESYCLTISTVRRDAIRKLKALNVPGYVRIQYNDAVQRLAETSHRKYLFHKDPTCQICFYLIERIEDATIDHIYPVSRGGKNALENKQIAHGKCNVLKSDKLNFVLRKPSKKL